MLRSLLLLTLLLQFMVPPVEAQDIACNPSTPIEKQSRTKMKHRAPAATDVSVTGTTVAEMLKWPAPAKVHKIKVREQDTAITPRENEVFRLEASLWRVKIEDNDCDFHLEVSDRGQGINASRVIVEIPQGAAFTTPRQDLVNALEKAAHGTPNTKKAIDLKKSLDVVVTGYAFYDAAHYSAKNPLVGKNHGTKRVRTLWELHPIWDIKFQ